MVASAATAEVKPATGLSRTINPVVTTDFDEPFIKKGNDTSKVNKQAIFIAGLYLFM